jgi:CRISPR-associated protein Cmr3
MSEQWIGLRLDAIDTLFFRDGRPFDASNRVVGGLPNPQTLAGALRTTLLGASKFFKDNPNANLRTILEKGDKAITEAKFRGPFLALVKRDNQNTEKEVIPLLEPPAILGIDKEKTSSEEKNFVRRIPTTKPLPGWNDPDGLLPLIWKDKKAPDPKGKLPLFTLQGIKKLLNEGTIDPNQTIDRGSLTSNDTRTGIQIDSESLATKEGGIYGIRLLSLNPKIKDSQDKNWAGYSVCLYAEMLPGAGGTFDCKSALNGTPIPFGGEGRCVVAHVVDAQDWPLPKENETPPARSLWYLATPTFLPFSERSKRPLPRGVKAAISGGGIAVSGWDVVHNGPHATRFAVPAGACYFFDQAVNSNVFLNDQLNDYKNLAQCGWGFSLLGKWEE